MTRSIAAVARICFGETVATASERQVRGQDQRGVLLAPGDSWTLKALMTQTRGSAGHR